ncbi:hypothetical protein X927_06075 [Petrotoga mexicana DSM 14811]|uniref:Uncharacterized protein n=1 Tax=Petrotoga mexicana DSM 14811 TaxID=1122954 RepID=A0A2K1P956_9BACT|nr:hypothetical protein [Petrotoga mexicana]PNR99236.1 hypothetical protein X927_06075 [Petrotoga mexicana DSM 14811]
MGNAGVIGPRAEYCSACNSCLICPISGAALSTAVAFVGLW